MQMVDKVNILTYNQCENICEVARMEDKKILLYVNGVPFTEDDKYLSFEEIFDKVKREEDRYFFNGHLPDGLDGIYLIRNGKVSRL